MQSGVNCYAKWGKLLSKVGQIAIQVQRSVHIILGIIVFCKGTARAIKGTIQNLSTEFDSLCNYIGKVGLLFMSG